MVYDHLRMTVDAFRWDAAEALDLTLQDGQSFPLELHVRHSTHLFDGHPAKEVLSVATALASLAGDTGIERVYGPFLDLSHPGNLSFVEIIPDLLSVHRSLHPVIQIGTREQGLDPHTLSALSLALSIRGQHRPANEAGSSGATVIVNGCDQRAFGHRVHSDDVLFSMVHRAATPGGAAHSIGPHSASLEIQPDSKEIATRLAQIGAVAGRNWRLAPTTQGRPPHSGSPPTQHDQQRRASENTSISCDALAIPQILETELTRQLGAWNDAGITGWSELVFPLR